MEAETLQVGASATELKERLAQAREKVEALVADVRAVDAELGSLANERRQHEQLQSAFEALQELDRLGGAGLFWGNGAASTVSEEHLRRARGRVDEFNRRLTEIEDRRRKSVR
jgi:hypothetical protein